MVNGKWLSASMSCIPYGNVGVLCLEVRVRVSNYKWPVLWRGWLMQILWGWHHNAVNKCISPAINLFRDVLFSSVWEILAQSHFKVWTLPLVFEELSPCEMGQPLKTLIWPDISRVTVAISVLSQCHLSSFFMGIGKRGCLLFAHNFTLLIQPSNKTEHMLTLAAFHGITSTELCSYLSSTDIRGVVPSAT